MRLKFSSPLFCFFAFGLFLDSIFSEENKLSIYAEQQIIESARYHFEIEGQINIAYQSLYKLLNQSTNEEIKTKSMYLLGKIYLKKGVVDSAISLFETAIAGRGLENQEKLWLYHKLVALSPNSLKPIVPDINSMGEPTRIFKSRKKTGREYILEFRSPPDAEGERTRNISLQNNDGNLIPFSFSLQSSETILDATPDVVLTQNVAAKMVYLRPTSGSKKTEFSHAGKIEGGSFLNMDSNSFVLLGENILRAYSKNKIYWEYFLKQEGCTWVPADLKRPFGLLQCGENKVSFVDILKKEVTPILNIKDKILQVNWVGNYIFLRFINRLEIRSSAKFEITKWQVATLPQEKLNISNTHVYLTSNKGSVRSYDLEAGHLLWQKDLLVTQLIPADQLIFATTFDKKVIAFDLYGISLWAYEYGWNREPLLLPNEHWVILQFYDGHRIKLDRELFRITGNANSNKFLNYPLLVKNKNWKMALNSVDEILNLEPGNGVAWMLRAATLKNMGASRQDQTSALIEASRSAETPSWSHGPILKNLRDNLGSNWIWKRQVSPKFYPNFIPHKDYAYYLENDNQTMVLLTGESGELVNSFRFSEELDLKINLWKNDTICVSSPSRLYLLTPTTNPSTLTQFPLKSPVNQALALSNGLVFSDWNGNLSFLSLPEKTIRWEKKLGSTGLFLAKLKSSELLDVVDLEGNYFSVQSSNGKINWSMRLPLGTITDFYANKDFVYVAYSQGILVALARSSHSVAWTVDFGEQLFSLSGNRENTLVVTTASKKLICLQAASGSVLSQIHLQSYIFNRPTVFDQGYWIGTNEPALEKRNFNHEIQLKYKLPDLPGSPIIFGNSIFIGTLDNFILSFPS